VLNTVHRKKSKKTPCLNSKKYIRGRFASRSPKMKKPNVSLLAIYNAMYITVYYYNCNRALPTLPRKGVCVRPAHEKC
jgi:hypothetical protein